MSKITRGSHVIDRVNWTQQELKLRVLALECLVTIIKSLVDWSKDLRIEKSVHDDHPAEETKEEIKKEKEEEDEEGDTEKEETEETRLARAPSNSNSDPNFLEIKEQKLRFTVGVNKFKLSGKKGLKFFIDNGFVDNEPEAIANFFRENDQLDRARIGEYIGQREEFPTQVRKHYVELFDFKGLQIDLALRKFLAAFRLPGEAQCIDRLMEKYADHYFSQNPESHFLNADAIYLLSFAIIMLATDLHSSAIKTKITKPEWIKNQHNNNDGKDYEPEFLSALFDRIQAQPITLDDGEFDATGELSTDPKQRLNRFTKEMERTISKSKKILKDTSRKDKAVYYRAKQIEHVKPMFELSWGPMMAAFSVLLEHTDDPDVINLCLNGFKYAIRVSCTFFMEVERNAFVTALAKFAVLNSTKEMKQKNVESIKTLIDIARTEANYLQDSWLQILTCVSHLHQLHLVSSGAKPQSFPTSPTEPLRTKRSQSNLFLGQYDAANATLVIDQIDVQLAIDRIFTSSARLNSVEIEHFVRCLCKVSSDEIELPNLEHRMFSLQKLVELAHFNMDRIRLVWTRIWNILADHFIKVGCNSNATIAMYAVDSLKQLAMKFLEKNELTNYQFQKEFLKPFEFIMSQNSFVKIRQLVIECLANMIQFKAMNIKSGWKSIFVVFTIAASDHDGNHIWRLLTC